MISERARRSRSWEESGLPGCRIVDVEHITNRTKIPEEHLKNYRTYRRQMSTR